MRISPKVVQRIDRRRFLVGAGGTILALPMLEAHAPRIAFGQSAAPPKRLIVLLHAHGRVAGGNQESGAPEDNWSPLKATGALPKTGDLSPLLAGLGDIRNEIVTIDQVDNLVRHMTGDADGHASAERTCLTCAVPPSGLSRASAASIDYVAGERLRAGASQKASIIFPAGAVPDYNNESHRFFGPDGTAPSLNNLPPADAAAQLFSGVMPSGGGAPLPPTTKTLADRLAGRRKSALDVVAKDFVALEKQVGAADRERLQKHADFLQSIGAQVAGGGGPTAVAEGCSPPDISKIPTQDEYENQDHDWSRGYDEAATWEYMLENAVQTLACDVTRVVGIQYMLDDGPAFPTEFDGPSPLDGDANWHTLIHDSDTLKRPNVANITQAFQFYNKYYTRLIQRLAAIGDTDGSRLLDNTLVVWTSDLGYGAPHHCFNYPIVMAGMKSAFANGQGRHLVCEGRRSLGDFWAQVLRMLGGDDQTFGVTGKVGDTGFSGDDLQAVMGAADFITTKTPLHLGELDL